MRRAIDIRPSGTWDGNSLVANVTLTFDDRFRRRLRLVDDGGDEFLLDLAEATRMEEGDGLVLEDGGIIAVQAAAEPIIDIQCVSASQAARVAWHLGNRHTPVQILDRGALRIREDHVLMEMVKGLGAIAVRRSAPFSPEPGAYAAGGGHGHGHSHGHSHDHDDHGEQSSGEVPGAV